MTTFESRRATAEARKAVATRLTSGSQHEIALQKYLAATTYLTDEAPQAPRRFPERPAGGASTADVIVAGVEGSSCAREAAGWAAAEADRRGATLLLVYTYMLPPMGYSPYNPYPPNVVDDLRAAGCAVLADTESELRRGYPDLPISTRMLYGDPAKVLARISASAAVTVVGAHSRNGVGQALGSVARHLAHANPVPVAVIRAGGGNPAGPVVVGLDGSAGSRAALSFALRTAAARGTTLIALWCRHIPAGEGSTHDRQPAGGPASPAQRQHGQLEDWLTRGRAEHSDVQVEFVVVDERPAPALLRWSGSAQLVVVGSRGHHRLTEMVLGSTSQALIARSATPVVVVPQTVEKG